jgi:hypothetical protein
VVYGRILPIHETGEGERRKTFVGFTQINYEESVSNFLVSNCDYLSITINKKRVISNNHKNTSGSFYAQAKVYFTK